MQSPGRPRPLHSGLSTQHSSAACTPGRCGSEGWNYNPISDIRWQALMSRLVTPYCTAVPQAYCDLLAPAIGSGFLLQGRFHMSRGFNQKRCPTVARLM